MNNINKLPIYIRLANSSLERFPDLSDKWDHEYGVLLRGIEEVWKLTRDKEYFKYIQKSIGPNIEKDGNINGYRLETFEMDNINSGRLLFELYRETKDERYKKAAYLLRSQFETHPKSSVGVFLHAKELEEVNFIDSTYMGLVYLIQFAKEFGDVKIQDDVVNQIITMAKLNQDKETGLLVQGYNHSKKEFWADPDTGLSPSFWGRGLGWYSVAVIETLELLPEDHPLKDKLSHIFKELMAGVLQVQDKKSGVWYQVVDKGEQKGNYLEASASSMFTYSLAKGIRLGYLNPNYIDSANRAYKGLQEEFIKIDEDGTVNLIGTCKSAGLGGLAHRDGSFEYYTSEKVADNDHKGVGTFLMAGVQVQLLNQI